MINTKTSLYAVIGDPVSHSLSPLMHNTAFSYIGYNAVYIAFQVKDISRAISGIRALGIKGVSVTIPHKVKVMEYLDYIDDEAIKIGAVNTIINREGELWGYNSDYIGANRAILEKTGIKDKDVLIIGAGGAARAIGYGIIKEGGKVTILNRSKEKGENLAKDIGANFFYPLTDVNNIKCHILINTTSIGMVPDIQKTPFDKSNLQKEMVVMDIVYNPLQTRLLKEASDIGCTIIDGISMFVYQGVFQFELWTGKKAPIDIMKKVVLNNLKGNV
ncbi:MAG: shikimate dehydrogenase [Desulfobacterales bacterium]|nr:shikimate dehydrogenase [Desulfobacterales bacterium]